MSKQFVAMRVMVMTMVLAFLPVWLQGQEVDFAKKAEELKTSAKNLMDRMESVKYMKKWQDNIDKYEKYMNDIDSLEGKIDQNSSKESQVKNHYELNQIKMNTLCFVNKTKRQFKTMYSEYDTAMLARMLPHVDNPEVKKTVEALLVCHRAEALLSSRYDRNRVNKGLANLEPLRKDKYYAEQVNDIYNRLNGYEAMTTKVKKALDDANKTKKPGVNDAVPLKKVYWNQTINGIGSQLAEKMPTPESYPFLYNVLMEAMEKIINEPDADINEIIDKLVKK